MNAVHRATQYAKDVVEGRIVAGKKVILACKRHLRDLNREGTKEFPYVFNEEQADDILEFAESLYIVEGSKKEIIELADFQIFILSNINGWVHKDTGFRRFRSSYIQLARQQGKSLLNGVLGAYYGNFTGYQYGQIYCVATKLKNARIVFKEIKKFIEADNELNDMFKIMDYKSTIKCLNTQSEIMALSGDTEIDGFRPYLGIIDEYHLHPTNQMFKQLEGGTGDLDETLISIITTAGFDFFNTPCFDMYEYCVQVLEEMFVNEERFIYIAQLDEEDDVWDSKNWIKANPLTCRTEKGISRMRTIAEEAKFKGGEDLRDFMTKRVNLWFQAADNQYLAIDEWKNCKSNRSLKNFTGEKTWIGLDLSSGGDLTSLGFVIPYYSTNEKGENVKKYFIHSHSFMPSNRVQEHIKTDNVPYDMWVKDKLVTVTETLGGIKTDYKYVLNYMKRQIEEYQLDVQMICYDPHNAGAFLHDLAELGYDTLSITQTHKFLNDPTVDFRLEVQAGNVEYNELNELLTWSAINSKTVSNSYGEIKIDKSLENKRIDPIDAIIDAWKMAMDATPRKVDLNQFVTDDYLKKLGLL